MSQAAPIFRAKHTVEFEHDPGTPVYRFFQDPQYADDFLNGKIWISTLGTCRGYENPQQGDPSEATMIYATPGTIQGGTKDVDFATMADKLGINLLGNVANVTITNASFRDKLEDALVICTTSEYNPDALGKDFGQFCVEITNPNAFFQLLTHELSRRYAIRQYAFGAVHYVERYHEYLDNLPAGIAFIKPPSYSYQKEVRMLWTVPDGTPVTPGLIHIPAASKYCRKIDTPGAAS
jgi:hypothetical protein